jgi:serine/threonine protein kinase
MSSRPKRFVPSIDQKNTIVHYPKIECSKSQNYTNDLIGENEGSTKNQVNAFFKSLWENHVKNKKPFGKGKYAKVFVSKVAFKFIQKPISNELDNKVYSTSESNTQLTMEETLLKYRTMVENEVRFQTIAAQKGVAPKVYTHFYTDDGAVIVMQALHRDFIDYVNEQGQISQQHTDRIVYILKTLSIAKINFNDINIIGNLMMDEKNQIYIVDFGMAKVIPETEFEMYGPYPLMRYLIELNKALGGSINNDTGLRQGPFTKEITEYEIKYNKEIDYQAHWKQKYIKRKTQRVSEIRRSERIRQNQMNEKKKMEQIGGILKTMKALKNNQNRLEELKQKQDQVRQFAQMKKKYWEAKINREREKHERLREKHERQREKHEKKFLDKD